MPDSNFNIPFKLSRRGALLAGGGAAAIASVALSLRPRRADISFLKGLDLSSARPLGDGFYEVDGWVLTADDLSRLGGAPPAETGGRR